MGGATPAKYNLIKVAFPVETTAQALTPLGPAPAQVAVSPENSDVRNAGHDGGDFLFVRKK